MERKTNNVDYDNDLCLMIHGMTTIELKLKRLSINAAKVGLGKGCGKTEIMRLCSHLNRLLITDGKAVEIAQNLIYRRKIRCGNTIQSEILRHFKK